jgi:hypothetical protein
MNYNLELHFQVFDHALTLIITFEKVSCAFNGFKLF